MRANHLVTFGLCIGTAATAAWFVGCGTDVEGTCSDTNTCGSTLGDASLDQVSGDDAPDGDDGTTGSDASDGGDGGMGDDASDGGGGMDAEAGVKCDSGTDIVCNGVCVSASDPGHCGSCSNVCPGPDAGMGMAQCTLGTDGGGVCSVQCGGTTSEQCGGSCFDPHDLNHCGSCTTVCPGPSNGNGSATCTGTTPTCGIACSTGYHVCSGQCLPDSDDPSTDPCVISDTFGVFVSPQGSDSNPGTMAQPYKTVVHAMDMAKGKTNRVYACGNAGTYDEHVAVGTNEDGVTVYGGLDCSSSQWTYNANDKAVVAPSTQGYALQVQSLATGVTFKDFGFTAQSATGQDNSGNGNSSIAAFVSGSPLTLVRVALTAGGGANGLPGANGNAAPNYSGPTAPDGNPGEAPDGGNGGGAGGVAACQYGLSQGGAGGVAGSATQKGGDGSPGQWTPAGTTAAPFDGVGGSGGLATCNGGDPGANGSAQSAGGAAGTVGSLSASGWTPSSGTAGSAGNPGEGGGGGGGKGAPSLGGSGGGAGGCGGSGGRGGAGGGGSIALASVNANVTLTSCTLATASGGNGADGGTGEDGQGGGNTAASTGCAGGVGGNGAGGSGGGGGTAGISVGILYTGSAPTQVGANTITHGTAGTPGKAGAPGQGGSNALGTGNSGDTPSSDGNPGAAADVLQAP